MSDSAAASGPRSVSIGGEVIRSIIVTGNYNQVFVGDYERLRDAYIAPWSVFERVQLDRFVGRDWLMKQVDAFLQQNDRGYFILEAAAGLGKTTFLAHLVRERSCIHHFVELAPGLDGIARGLKNLVVQLVRAWELNPYLAEGILPGVATRPDFLQTLLFEAAHRRDEIKPCEKIVLVVDALDEAGTPPGQNVLGLPRVLPRGVYFIVSQRPVAVPLAVEEPPRVFHLPATHERNLTDMRAYLERATTWQGIKQALQGSGCTEAQFVEILLQKCQGLWIYVHYVVGEIERGERSPLDLNTLPEGVWQYYAQYWLRWQEQHPVDWNAVHLPVLSTLAAVQEDVTLGRLCILAGVAEQPALHWLLAKAWRPFLVLVKANENYYRLYHASLREFFDGRMDLTDLRTQEQDLVHELAQATCHAHTRIADRYLTHWGGLDAGLPDLQDPAQRDLDGGYGLRHLAAHLEGAERGLDLHRLLRVDYTVTEQVPNQPQNLWARVEQLLHRQRVRTTTHIHLVWQGARDRGGDIGGFLSDVTRAWSLAEAEAIKSPNREERNIAIGRQCRYALISASMHSQAGNIPSALLVALIENRVWEPIRGLRYARQILAPSQQAEVLAKLVPLLPLSLLQEVLVTAQAIDAEDPKLEVMERLLPRMADLGAPAQALALAIKLEGWQQTNQARALVAVAPCLPDLLRLEALEAARAITAEIGRAYALTGLIEHLPAHEQSAVLREALLAAQGIEWEDDRARTLAKLAPHLTPPLLLDALITSHAIADKWERARALVGLIPHLSEPEQGEMLDEVLVCIKPIERWERLGEEIRVQTFTQLAPYLPEPLLRQALTIAQALEEGRGERAEALAGMAPHLSEALQTELLMSINTMLLPWEQAHVLTALAPHLKGPLLHNALAPANAIKRDGEAKLEALVGIAPYLPSGQRSKALRKASAIARVIEDSREKARALQKLASGLAKLGYLAKALAAARSILEKGLKVQALTAVALYFPANKQAEVLCEALMVVRAIESNKDRAEGLTLLAPHLPKPLLNEALAIAQEIGDTGNQAQTIAHLAPLLVELGDLTVAWLLISAIGDEIKQLQTFVDLVAHMANAGLLNEALAAVRGIDSHEHRAQALEVLVPHLPEPLLREAWIVTRAIKGTRYRYGWIKGAPYQGGVLAKLLPRLAELGHPDEALMAVRSIRYPWDKVEALTGLTPYLSVPLLREALRMVRAITWVHPRAEGLATLAPWLPEPLLREALTAAWAMKDKEAQARAFVGLLPRLAELGYPTEAMAAIAMQALESGHFSVMVPATKENQPWIAEENAEWVQTDIRVQTMTRLAPHLSEPLLHELLAALQRIEGEWYPAQALLGIAPYLSVPLLHEALATTSEAQATTTEHDRQNALVTIVQCLATEHFWKNNLLEIILSRLVELGHKSEVLETACTIKSDRAYILEALALCLAKRGYPSEALTAVRSISTGEVGVWIKARTLAGIAPYLPEPLLYEALLEVTDIYEHAAIAEALTALVSHLPRPLQSDLSVMKRIFSLFSTWHILSYCFDYLDVTTIMLRLAELGYSSDALAAIPKVWELLGYVQRFLGQDHIQMIAALRKVALGDISKELLEVFSVGELERLASVNLSGYVWITTLYEALAAVRQTDHEDIRADCLSALIPLLPEQLLGKTLIEVIADGKCRSGTLKRIAPYLATLPFKTLYPLWCEMLHRLSSHRRADLLVDLTALAPVIAALGGKEAIAETVQAVIDVGHWFP